MHNILLSVFKDFNQFSFVLHYVSASKFHGPERIKDNELCYCQPLPDKALAGDELCCCCRIHQQQKTRLRGGGETKRKMKLCKMCKHAAENIAGRAGR